MYFEVKKNFSQEFIYPSNQILEKNSDQLA